MLNLNNVSASTSEKLQAFLNNDESTMNPFTNASVGALLFRLADIYLPNAKETEQQRTAEKEKYIDKSIIALKTKLTDLKDYFKTSEAELNAVLAYIEQKIQQAPNELDKVYVFKDGKIITRVIPLKEVLALVFTALTDKEAFKPAIEQAFPGASDEEKEVTLKKNEKNYLLTLYNTLNRLRKGKANGQPFCHTGVRNDCACSLNGVYPGVHIIEQVDTAISTTLQEFVLEKLKGKTAAEQFNLLFHKLRENVLLDETSDFEALVSDEHFQKEAKAALERFCLDNGLNPNDKTMAKMISDHLIGLPDVPAPLSIHPYAPYLQELMNFVYLDKTLPEVVQENLQAELNLLTSFEETEQNGLLHRLKAARLWRAVKKYENIPIVGEEEAKFATSVKELLDFLLRYFQQPSRYAASIEDDTITKHIAIIKEQEKKEPHPSFVANFFLLWLQAKSPAEQAPLRNRLLAEKPKLLLTDVHLALFFANRTEDNVVHIEQDVINRILLHAMLSPVEDWTKSFHDHLCRIIAFIQNDFKENSSEAAPSLNAVALRKDSYPDDFLKWFAVLQKLCLKVQQNEGPYFKAAAAAIQAGMLEPTKKLSWQNWQAITEAMGDDIAQFTQNGNQLANVLKLLDQSAHTALINTLGEKLETIIIKDYQLANVLSLLGQNAHTALINILGEKLKTIIIIDFYSLIYVLRPPLVQSAHTALINTLGDKLKTIIQDSDQLFEVLRHLPRRDRPALINVLGYDFIKTIIQDGKQLAEVFGLLDQNVYTVFITALGYDFKTIIQDGKQLAQVLQELDPRWSPRESRAALINALGPQVQTIIKDGDQLAKVLQQLDSTARPAFLSTLGYDFVKTIIQDGGQLVHVLRQLPRRDRPALIKALGYDFIKTIIQDGKQLAEVLELLDQNVYTVFITALGYDFIKTIIQNSPQLVSILKLLDPNARPALINALGAQVQTIIKDDKQLAGVLQQLDSTARPALINTLGAQVQIIIKDGDQLANKLRLLDRSAHASLINALGAQVQTIIKDRQQLDWKLKQLDQNARPALINALGDKLKTIIKDGNQLELVLNRIKGTHAQLRCLIQLNKKELLENINPKTEAMIIYAGYCRFAQGQKLAASKAILKNYIQPEGLGFFKLAVRDSICLDAVRSALKSSTIDGLLIAITNKVPLDNIRAHDASLFRRLQYVCALGDQPLEAYNQAPIAQPSLSPIHNPR